MNKQYIDERTKIARLVHNNENEQKNYKTKACKKRPSHESCYL